MLLRWQFTDNIHWRWPLQPELTALKAEGLERLETPCSPMAGMYQLTSSTLMSGCPSRSASHWGDTIGGTAAAAIALTARRLG